MSEWSEWFVYRLGGTPVGPLSSKAVAQEILAGRLPEEAWVAAPGGSRWLRAVDVPVIAAVLTGASTRRPSPSGMRMATAPLHRRLDATIDMADEVPVTEREPPEANDVRTPECRTVVSRVADAESPVTERSVEPRGTDGFPVPPPSSTPTPPSGYRAGDAIAEPTTPRKRSQSA